MLTHGLQQFCTKEPQPCLQEPISQFTRAHAKGQDISPGYVETSLQLRTRLLQQ